MAESLQLGKIVFTPGTLNLAKDNPDIIKQLITKHVKGEQGLLDDSDHRCNQQALKEGTRIFSKFKLNDGAVYIITEADRSMTTVMLPNEY